MTFYHVSEEEKVKEKTRVEEKLKGMEELKSRILALLRENKGHSFDISDLLAKIEIPSSLHNYLFTKKWYTSDDTVDCFKEALYGLKYEGKIKVSENVRTIESAWVE